MTSSRPVEPCWNHSKSWFTSVSGKLPRPKKQRKTKKNSLTSHRHPKFHIGTAAWNVWFSTQGDWWSSISICTSMHTYFTDNQRHLRRVWRPAQLDVLNVCFALTAEFTLEQQRLDLFCMFIFLVGAFAVMFRDGYIHQHLETQPFLSFESSKEKDSRASSPPLDATNKQKSYNGPLNKIGFWKERKHRKPI